MNSNPPSHPGAAFLFIFITYMLELALGVMIPVLPKLIAELERGDMANAAGVFGFLLAGEDPERVAT